MGTNIPYHHYEVYTRASTESSRDLATRLRNGHLRQRSSVICFASKLGQSVLNVLWREGFIYGYRILENGSEVEVFLKYSEGLPVVREIKLVSMPGRPVYFSVQDLNAFKEGTVLPFWWLQLLKEFYLVPKQFLRIREVKH